MSGRRRIEASDILDPETYARQRRDRRAAMVALKHNRRIAIGPNATVHFENFDTMLYQVQEMLHAERGGAAQIAAELEAYNPLVPQGDELVATLMLEMEDAGRRAVFLRSLGGVEKTAALEIGGETVAADWERDVERTAADGKTSAVHFLRFRLAPQLAAKFREPGARAVIAINHPNYGHAAVLPEAVRAELARDL